ncbi:hypothetical protein [Altericroceibacterium xinjiangense]|uniref:hypothetical protein n=1 Tax=Altericroceibacterium xinjiangense TaxID=762261 RepID=UPI001F4930C6|nr:hypothetical protein [Altericroceibacterium xinjiangense]
MRPYRFTSLAALALGLAMPAYAQDAEPETPVPGEGSEAPAPDETLNEIVVIAQKMRGQVDAPEPPILELDEEQIASYGAGSLADLVAALAPQTGSGSGRGSGPPAFLVNGVRVSSFREMRSYPPEAIRRVEVLPETVAQRYGFPPDQRVINFILKDQYASREIELEYGQPAEGGYSTKEIEATLLRIAGPSRLNLNLELSDSSLLTEAERGVVQAEGSVPTVITDPDPAAYRSLVADSADYELTANWTRSIGESGGSLSLNGTIERSDSLALSGLNTVSLIDPDAPDVAVLRSFGDPLERWARTDTLAAGATLNTYAGDWQLTGTVDASHARLVNRIDRRVDTDDLLEGAAAGLFDLTGDLPDVADARFDEAVSKTDNATLKVTAIGRPIRLPAGEISATLDAGYDWSRIQSEDTRNLGLDTDVTRGNLNAGITLGIPLASRREDVWSFLGDFTLNLTAGVNHLSDFGTLTNWSTGFTWGVTERLNLQASYIVKDAAPSLTQLGAPEIITLNAPVYDFITGQAVLASVVSGGNPNLAKERQNDLRLAAFWEIPWFQRSNLLLEYFHNDSENVSAAFPLLTPAIEAAFPGRVTRSDSGQLLAIDQRPVTFARQESSRIRYGINLAGQIGRTPDEPEERGFADRPGGRRDGGGPAAQSASAAPPGQGGGPGAGGQFDPQPVAALRERLCASDAQQTADRAVTPEDVAALPEGLQSRLRNPDGTINTERLAAFRTRLCSQDGAAGLPGTGAQGGDAPPAGGRPAGGRGRGGPGFGPGGPGGGNVGRWNLSLTHSIELENEVLIAPGGPLLDLLGGDALSGGGVSRHTVTLEGGGFYKGFGVRVSGNYLSGTDVSGTGLPGSSDLRFGDLATFNLRFFADLGRQQSLVEAVPFLKNTRASFSIDNVFDARRRVTDENGVVPFSYQPYLIDPVGRFFEVEFRKLF